MPILRAIALAILLTALGLASHAQEPQVVLDEDFSGALPRWGLPNQGGALFVERGVTIVPVFKVRDATVEYRVKVKGEGLIEFMFRYDMDTDDYYIFRVDTRKAGGNPPAFLKRQHDTPPWVIAGERTGETPPTDTWLDVKVEIAGGRFRGYVDGEPVASFEDDDFESGGFAFRQQVSDGWVDDLKITVPAGAGYTLLEPRKPPKEAAPPPFTEGVWSAHWIWSPGSDEELVRVLRNSFEAPEAIREATVAVTCDNEYELYLNGKLVGRDSDWYGVEVYDVGKLVRPGQNTFAALCTNHGPGAAGLLLEFGATAQTGEFVHVISDETWKVAKRAAEGWADADYDDSGWEQARSVGKQPCGPWAGQTNLPLPFLGPKQPIELVNVLPPAAITIGKPFEVTATWKPIQALKEAYPIILTASQGGRPPVDLAVFEPAAKTWAWKPGEEHTETIEAELWPDAAYFFDAGRIKLGLEIRGTFYPNRKSRVVADINLLRPATARSRMQPTIVGREPKREGRFTDPTGQEHAWSLNDLGQVVVSGTAHIPLDADGVYWCEAESGGEALAALEWRSTVERLCARGGPSGADFVRVRLVDHIDATQADHQFSEDGGLGGKSRVVRIGDRSYRVTSARNRLSYFAYTATCRHPRNPHVMMFQSVNDIERYTTLRIQPPWDNVGGGVYTGREYPCDGRPFEHRFMFYPRAKGIRFTVSRLANEKPVTPGSGAAVSHIWLFELADPLASRPVTVARPAGAERRLGMYLTNPRYLYSLYGYRGRGAEDRRASLRSFIDYMSFCGMNLLEFNAVDGGDTTGVAYYDSELWPRAAGNLLEELLPLCEAADIQLIPIITSLSVPEGKFGFTRDSFQMDRHGNLTQFFGTRPPLPDPLRPEVQDLIIRNLREILDICAQSKAVPAIGFRVNGKIGLCYGGSQLGKSDQYTGYSKWDVAQFEKDTGIDVPEMAPTPYEWIKENCWERWLDWRCERTRDFWLRCRDAVREYREDLVLYISCDMPSETPAWNIYWPQGETPLDCCRYHGVDPRMFADESGILLQRGMMVAADRYFTRHGQYAKNVEAMKEFHYAPGVTELYEGREGNACELYHNYWEEFGVFKTGEFRTNFWGAATMYGFGRNYFEPIAFSLAKTNCHTLNLFSWERGSFGHEHDLRMFARAFRALPREEGTDASDLVMNGARGLWVRLFGDRVAVLDTTGHPRTVKLRYAPELPPHKDLIEFGRYEVIVPRDAQARMGLAVELPLRPYELRVLGSL